MSCGLLFGEQEERGIEAVQDPRGPLHVEDSPAYAARVEDFLQNALRQELRSRLTLNPAITKAPTVPMRVNTVPVIRYG